MKTVLSRYAHWIRLGSIVTLICIIAFVARKGITLTALQEQIAGAGFVGILMFLIIYTAGASALVPALVLSAAGALLYGPWWGTLFNLIGATMGATLSFTIADWFGKDAFQSLVKGRMKKLQRRIKKNGFESVIILRVLPIIPYNILNYGLGFTTVNKRDYIWGTFIGMIPGTLLYTWAIATAGELILQRHISYTDIFSMLLPLALLGLLTLTPFLYRRYRNNTQEK